MKLFKSLSVNSDFIDGSYVKAHQHSTGVASKQEHAIALSRGGNASKIHLTIDRYGLPIEYYLKLTLLSQTTAMIVKLLEIKFES